jgi:hypothetical protein
MVDVSFLVACGAIASIMLSTRAINSNMPSEGYQADSAKSTQPEAKVNKCLQ